jgi:predicted RNA-binding Zn-ribbon protein involved in translation (DUF1610 family)
MFLHDGPLVTIEPSEEFPGGFEVTLKRNGIRFDIGAPSAAELLAGLSRLLDAAGPAEAAPDLASLICAACGAEVGPRTHRRSVVLPCPHCRALGFWPRLSGGRGEGPAIRGPVCSPARGPG